MGIFGKSKKQKEKEAAELQAKNDQISEEKAKLVAAQQAKEKAQSKQKDCQIEIEEVKKVLAAGEAAFNEEKTKYDAEMAKLEAHNKLYAKVYAQKKRAAEAKAALEDAQRLLQDEKELESKEALENAQQEAKMEARLVAAKVALQSLENSKEKHTQYLAGACIAGAVAKHEEKFAHEQHARMLEDIQSCTKSIPSAKERLAEAQKIVKPVLEAHEIAHKILEEKRGVARVHEAEEGKARAALGVVQQELAKIDHSKAQCESVQAGVEKTRFSKETDLSVVQREISDLENRYKSTKQDIQETTQAQQNAEERLEAARGRFGHEQSTLERVHAEKQELEEKVDSAEEDLRTAKAARERSEALLEALKAEMTSKITELTWVQKECSELRMMSTKNLRELSTFVEKRNAELTSYRANHMGAKHEAVIDATERQKLQDKDCANISAMSLLNNQSLRKNNED